jgi:hypothetical protein
MMKTHTISLFLALLTVCVLSGCNKHEETAPPAAPVAEAPKPVTPPTPDATMTQAVEQQAAAIRQNTDAAAAKAQEQTSAATTTVVNAASDAQDAAQKTATNAQARATADSAQAQGLIDKAKQLIADKDWQGALKTLTDLSSYKLTPDQQKMVDALKQQAQSLAQSSATKSATDAGTKAVGNLLKKP